MSIIEGGVGAVNVAFHGQDLRDATELIVNESFAHDSISDYLTTYEGIVAKQQIGIVAPLEKIIRKDLGCGEGLQVKKIGISEKYWDPVDLKIRLAQCYSDFNNTLFTWAQANGISLVNEPIAAATELFILEQLRKAIELDMPRIAWFSDVDADTFANGGKLTNTSSPLDYDQVDGIWKQIYAGITATKVKNVDISENNAVSKVLQLTLAANKTYDTIEALFDKADPRLLSKQGEMPFMIATRGLYNNYMKTLRGKGNDSAFEVLINGIMVPAFDGVPMFVSDTMTRAIIEDFDNGTTYDNPHRLVLGKKSGLGIGYNSSAFTNEIKGTYSEESERYFMNAKFKMDVKLLQEHLVAVAI